MNQYLDTWGLYIGGRKTNIDYIHPSSRQAIKGFDSWTRILKCTEIIDKEYIKIIYGESGFIVKPELFDVTPSPSFMWGDHVIELTPTRGEYRKGVINEICWNYRREYIYYQIFTNGRLSGKMYKDGDLELIT